MCLKTARNLVRKEPCFSFDFQILLDAKGRCFHIDYDRCLETRAKSEVGHALKAIGTLEMTVQNVLAAAKPTS